VTAVLHILPHPGGGGEGVVDLLEDALPDFTHRRTYLTGQRTPLVAGAQLVARRPGLARDAARADIVHVIGDAGACLTVRLLRRSASVFGTHGLHVLRRAAKPVSPLVRARLRQAVASASVTVCSSEPEFRELSAIATPDVRARLRLVLNGIPLPEAVSSAERRAARDALAVPEDAFTLLYAGQLEPRKRALDAARAALELEEPTVMLVAGDGPERGEVEQLAGDRIRVLGERSDVPRLLAAADVLVMPSEREGLSLAVLEAMGRGLPVVVSDGLGNPETVATAGVVVPLGDVSAFARAFERLAADPSERSRLGDAARERVRTVFSQTRWRAEMRAAFEEVLAARGA
jgi:glycosyltransferase involved in cell wall biosynthesis